MMIYKSGPRRWFQIARWIMRNHPIAVLLLVGFVGVFIIAIIGGVLEARARSSCLTRGYPAATITWGGFGDTYCIRRVDQTDEVVPLEKL